MANLIIKSSADNLVLQGSDASPAITVGATGTTTFAESVTFAGGKLFHGMTSITATGATTWTKPDGVTAIMVYITGGGGGAGSGGNAYNSFAAGGAGGTAIKWITSGIGATETVTIGTGGAGGAAGNGNIGTRGVTSSFGSHCSATGGHFGPASATYVSFTDSDRGNGVSGDINLFGGDGGQYQGGDVSTDYAGASCGGGSYWGGGGGGGESNGVTGGRPGRAYGAGGGAGDHGGASAYGAGGDGKSGICVIYTYIG